MNKKIAKINFTIIALVLSLCFGLTYCVTADLKAKYDVTNVSTRTIEVNKSLINYQSVFNDFEDAKFEQKGSVTTFEGKKHYNVSDFYELDEVNESNVVSNEGFDVKYQFSYDADSNLAKICAQSYNESGLIETEEIEGLVVFDANGNYDVLFEIEGEYCLLSEMQESGLIQNCGWFKNLFKKVVTKVVVATVAVVAVAAATAVVVATCGAGLGAVIAAGAVAGGVTGAVAGGVISYSEYGKLDWRWVAGGAVIGAALGAATGWGVGTALCQPTTAVNGFINKNFEFSNTVLGHADRPYRDSQLLAKEIMKAGTPVTDPGGVAGGLKWVVPGSYNGTLGTWELVYDTAKNMIIHFLFKV